MARVVIACLCACLFSACASYTDETREIRSLYRSGAYKGALENLDKSSLADSDRNRLLYLLERASILDKMGEGEKARKLWLEADALADKLFTVSVTRTASSFVVSESMTDYTGEDYEKVAIHTQIALSFLADDDQKSALVSARKINSKLEEINQQHGDYKNRYAEDALARYLSGMIYESQGEWDSAIIDYTKALQTYRSDYGKLGFSSGVPDTLVEALYRLLKMRGRTERLQSLKKDFPKQTAKAENINPDWGEIAVIHEVGNIAVKETSEFFPLIGKQVIRFSFPVIKKGHRSFRGATGFEIVGRDGFVGADLVQDMDAIAYATLEDRRLRLIAKQTARLLAKGQLTEQAYKNFGVVGGLAANVFSAVTETADTRSWSLLPESYFVTRQRVPAGTYKVKIKNAGRLGDVKTVKVAPRRLVLLTD